VQMMGGLIDVDLATQVTGLAGVFAAGDAAGRTPGQPGTIISAIAAGRRAAAAIDRHLGGDGEIGETLYADAAAAVYSGEREEGFAYKPRLSEPTLPLPERTGSFMEVNRGFNAETAMAEAGRCLNCDLEIAMARNGGPPA
jgi:formate dehydrogenase beta subunit